MPRLSFSLRDVFWLTLVVGIGCAWGMDNRQHQKQAADFADFQEYRIALQIAMNTEGMNVGDNGAKGRMRKVTIYTVPSKLRDLKYDLKVAERKLAMLESRLADEGRKVKWVWADGEVSLKIEE